MDEPILGASLPYVCFLHLLFGKQEFYWIDDNNQKIVIKQAVTYHHTSDKVIAIYYLQKCSSHTSIL